MMAKAPRRRGLEAADNESKQVTARMRPGSSVRRQLPRGSMGAERGAHLLQIGESRQLRRREVASHFLQWPHPHSPAIKVVQEHPGPELVSRQIREEDVAEPHAGTGVERRTGQAGHARRKEVNCEVLLIVLKGAALDGDARRLGYPHALVEVAL